MQHRYAPLPEGFIRLLELHPGKTGDVISFELHDVDLLGDPHIPSFDASSYEWGSKVGTVPVQCNQDRLLITPNCKAAVERLRYEKEPRILWIDAICINQEDKKECSSQVAMMNSIFRAAKVVLMWLGKEEEDSEAAFSSIPILARAYEQADRSSFGASVASFRAGAILEAVNTIPDQEQVANGWASLARRTYFQRAWIFQEVILAGSRGLVLCGDLSSPWDPFEAALQGYMAWQGDRVGSTGRMMENDDDFREAGKLSFPEALAAMTRLGCSDARDKVFATLGLVEQDYIAADYASSLEEVMVKANVLILHTTKTLWHWQFTRSQDGPTSLHGLPSWAVDFTQPARSFAPPWEESVEFSDFIPNRNRHRASLTGSFYVDGSIVDRVMCTAAITIDKETFDIAKPIIQAMSRSLRGVYDLYSSAGKIHNKGEKKKMGRRCPTRRKTNGEALLAAILKPYDGDESTREEDADVEAFLAWKLSRWEDDGIISAVEHDHISKQPTPTHLRSRVAAWDARSRNAPKTFDLDVCRRMERRHCFGRHLVYTEKGSLGISHDAEVGEGMAVVVLGAALDLTVLQKRKPQKEESDAECYYERVGSVFLYGWDKQRITTLEDIDENAEVVRLQIR
ncbi:heterokaryon incompatibility protein-domain-containing protein [Apiospora saccharicola]|uniref:Heterokaryon incompatibility protein-domain-containing protein n=1 Tax=Apiospora saccharicola TaxID=335842 RepID=A0ABR1UPY5_9PEZI